MYSRKNKKYKEDGKMKKKILIVLAIIIVIALVVVGYFVVSDLMQEGKLQKELEEISNLSNAEEIDMEQIEERLNRTVTTGDYAVVEKAFKQYLMDSMDNMTLIAQILSDERMIECLTAENYTEDGPEFTETKEYLTETKEQLEKLKNEYVQFYTEEKVMSYINDKGLDEYYIDYYKTNIAGDILSNDTQLVETSIDDLIQVLDATEDVINFLAENKNSWQIEDGNIVFDSDALSNQYDGLIEKLYEE